MTNATPLNIGSHREASRFLRFCAVGGLGFLVDATFLRLGIAILALDPITARLGSVTIAVIATFLLNRHWAFRIESDGKPWQAFVRYLAVQGCGFLCNFAIYAVLTVALPERFDAPLLCLAVASGLALAINYLGARLVVFRG